MANTDGRNLKDFQSLSQEWEHIKESSGRYNYLNDLQESSFYIRYNRDDMLVDNVIPEPNNTNKVFDSTAADANERLASNLRFTLMDVNDDNWFGLSSGDDTLDENYYYKEWLRETTRRINKAFYTSGLGLIAHELFLDLPALCMGAMYIEEGRPGGAPFSINSIHLKNITVGEDANEKPNSWYVEYEYTAQQAQERFGFENLSLKVQKQLDDGNQFDKSKYLHIVKPRVLAEQRGLGNTRLPFASFWLDLGDNRVISESGYYEQPYVTPRWSKRKGDTFGVGPGINKLPTIKVINAMERNQMLADGRKVEPPMDVEVGAYDKPLKMSRRAINKRNKNSNPAVPIIQDAHHYQIEQWRFEQRRDEINEAFFRNALSLIDRSQMTATEVMQRTRENLKTLGPVYERLVTELLDPLIRRAYGIMKRGGMLPDVPDELRGKEINVIYKSPLAIAQEGAEVEAIVGATEYTMGIMNVDPSQADVVNFDTLHEMFYNKSGLGDAVRAPDEIEQRRMARAQAQQKAAQMEAAQAGLQNRQAGG